MKRNILQSVCLFFMLLLMGCFEDKGNYTYDELITPKWLLDVKKKVLQLDFRMGEMAVFKGSESFIWGADSVERMEQYRYEWKVGDILLSDRIDFEMPTAEFVEKVNFKEFTSMGISGTFSIIEKATGITHMARARIVVSASIKYADCLVLIDDGSGEANCIYVRKNASDAEKLYELNEGLNFKVPGKPIRLATAKATNISSLGSTTVITDQGAYEYNNGVLAPVDEIRNQFLEGAPADFNVVARRDAYNKTRGLYTFVATDKGKLYTRQTSPSGLGGKFISEPYVIDGKGYSIQFFGNSLNGMVNIPCYDEKNRRVVMINFYSKQYTNEDGFQVNVPASRIIPTSGSSTVIPPVWNMPEGTEILHLAARHDDQAWLPNGSMLYTVIYNDIEGNTKLVDFIAHNESATCSAPTNQVNMAFPGGKLNKESLILTSTNEGKKYGATRNRILYSRGNELRYIERADNYSDHLFKRFDSKVTCIAYDKEYDNGRLLVGCENGDFFIYNIENILAPVEHIYFKLKGRVVSAVVLDDLCLLSQDAY